MRLDLCLILIAVVTTLLYGLLVVRDRVPTAGLIVLAGLCLVPWLLTGRLSYATPLDYPIIALLALLPLSLSLTFDQSLTVPKIQALVLCVVFFYVIVNYLRHFSRLKLAILGIVLLAFILPTLAVLATNWAGSDFSLPVRAMNRLTALLPFLSRFSAGGGIHVNTTGGTLAFFVPLLLSLLWDNHAFSGAFLAKRRKATLWAVLYKVLICLALVYTLVILVFTSSRGSYLGVLMGIFAVLVWKDKRFLWLIPIGVLVFAIALFVFANGNLADFIALLDTSAEGDTVPVRLQYWQRTLFMIQDFSITGSGIGTYGRVFDELYTFNTFSVLEDPSFYAHNMYLAVAAGMGIPALILYLSLFAAFATMIITTVKNAPPIVRVTLIGLSSGMLAHMVYGLWDNYMLGEKLALVLWLFFALATALYIHRDAFNPQAEAHTVTPITFWQTGKRWAVTFFIGLANWVLFSAAAIALINLNPYLSLTLVVLGGVVLGFLLTRRFTHLQAQINPLPAIQ